jgi:hypothetical protein
MAEHTNGYDKDQLQSYLDEVAEQDDALLSLKSDYMNACKGPRSKIKDILARAKEADINMVAFREVLAKHRDVREQERRIADLEDDDRSAFELMLDALGEFGNTPLGQAALDRAKQSDETLGGLTQG